MLIDLGDTLVHLDRPWEDVFQRNLAALHNYLNSLGINFDSKKFDDRFVRIFNDASYRADLFKIEVPMEEIISKSLRKSGLQVLGIDLPTSSMMEFTGPRSRIGNYFPTQSTP